MCEIIDSISTEPLNKKIMPETKRVFGEFLDGSCLSPDRIVDKLANILTAAAFFPVFLISDNKLN